MTLRSRIHLYAAGRIVSHGFRAIAAFDTALAAKGQPTWAQADAVYHSIAVAAWAHVARLTADPESAGPRAEAEPVVFTAPGGDA